MNETLNGCSKISFVLNKSSGCTRSFCYSSPENHCTGREEDEESHGRVRDEVGRAVVPDAHHRSRLALVQELHEGVTNLYVERLDEFFYLT